MHFLAHLAHSLLEVRFHRLFRIDIALKSRNAAPRLPVQDSEGSMEAGENGTRESAKCIIRCEGASR